MNKNITLKTHEQLISLETAKLAKEKGLKSDEIVHDWCYINDTLHTTINMSEYLYQQKKINNYLPAITQSLLQKWLREKNNIDIEIRTYYSKHKYYFLLYKNNLPINLEKEIKYDSYEDALEDALQEAINLIN